VESGAKSRSVSAVSPAPAPSKAALVGALCTLPFLAANLIVVNRIEPFFSLIRPGLHTSAREYVLLAVVLLLLPVGAFIAARPIFGRPDGPRRFHAVNALLSLGLVLVFLTLAAALGSEIYRCDVLGVPNCD
jgi:hypothetical protein